MRRFRMLALHIQLQVQVLLALGVSYTLMGILYPLRYEQILRKNILIVPNGSRIETRSFAHIWLLARTQRTFVVRVPYTQGSKWIMRLLSISPVRLDIYPRPYPATAPRYVPLHYLMPARPRSSALTNATCRVVQRCPVVVLLRIHVCATAQFRRAPVQARCDVQRRALPIPEGVHVPARRRGGSACNRVPNAPPRVY